MHGLHEGTEKVHTRETDAIIVTLDGVHHLLTYHLTKAARVCVCTSVYAQWHNACTYYCVCARVCACVHVYRVEAL